MRKNKIIAICTISFFLFGLTVCTSSCGSSRSGHSKSKVKSGSGMGNKSDRNRGVWGK